MIDSSGAIRNKEKILSLIRLRGPSLPVQLTKELGVPSIFAAAFLSELKAEGKILISNLKVGSSPLYYLTGQEQQLENFVQYMNQREKEAFELLKKEKVLEDEKQEPVIRVALRAIKDFAIESRLRVNGEPKAFWRYFSVPEQELISILRESLEGAKKTKDEIAKERSEEKKEGAKEKIEKETVLVAEKPKRKLLKRKTAESGFGNRIRDFLVAKDIEVKQVLSEKKKEFEAVVRIDMQFGKQEFYLVAREKKKVGDNELAVALQKAQNKKMPALFIANGELNKKGKEYLQDWSNLLKFEEFKF